MYTNIELCLLNIVAPSFRVCCVTKKSHFDLSGENSEFNILTEFSLKFAAANHSK